MNIVLFDTSRSRKQLYPLSLTKPLADIRHGIFTPREWFQRISGEMVYSLSENYLCVEISDIGPWHCVDASVVPEPRLFEILKGLSPGAMIEDENGIIGYLSESKPVFDNLPLFFQSSQKVAPFKRISHPMDLVRQNGDKISADTSFWNFPQMTPYLKENNRVTGHLPILAENGVRMSGCIINTEEGPVHIGENAYVMEGSLLRGPVSIGKNAVIKMGAQIYSGTTIGQHAVAGGEIKNSILGDFSNKAHHGYLGDSITGEWCNLGAGTTNSNVKNNASVIKMWSEEKKENVSIGQKAGFVMGGFCKTAINTTLNSGTTIGVATSIHKPGFPAKKVASFEWGPGERYLFNQLLESLKSWHSFKGVYFSEKDQGIMEYLFHSHREV